MNAEPITAPTISDDTPAFPEPGIYFDFDEEEYHRVPAASASGIKEMIPSTMNYWATSWMCAEYMEEQAEKEGDENYYFTLGKAYHARILEGVEALNERFAVELTPPEGVELLTSIDQIKAAIKSHSTDDNPVKPVTRVPIDEGSDDMRTAKKGDWIEQLLDLDPEAAIWDAMVERHEKANEGKMFIKAEDRVRIEWAAASIERHPQLSQAFTGGWPEVSLFWYDAVTGVPMKARADYLKMAAITDLKSFENQPPREIQRAIDRVIANQKHYIPVVVYQKGIAAIKKLITPKPTTETSIDKRDTSCIHGTPQQVEWALKWANKPAPEALWVYQQKGRAVVTRGRIMSSSSSVYQTTEMFVEAKLRLWAQMANEYGSDPWLDLDNIVYTEDEKIPLYATTDFGDWQ